MLKPLKTIAIRHIKAYFVVFLQFYPSNSYRDLEIRILSINPPYIHSTVQTAVLTMIVINHCPLGISKPMVTPLCHVLHEQFMFSFINDVCLSGIN